MIKYESNCVDCEWCTEYKCPFGEKIPVHYCDECKNKLDEVYVVNEKEICEDCLRKKFKRG